MSALVATRKRGNLRFCATGLQPGPGVLIWSIDWVGDWCESELGPAQERANPNELGAFVLQLDCLLNLKANPSVPGAIVVWLDCCKFVTRLYVTWLRFCVRDSRDFWGTGSEKSGDGWDNLKETGAKHATHTIIP